MIEIISVKDIKDATPFHMMAVPKMMLPVIDDKLQEELKMEVEHD